VKTEWNCWNYGTDHWLLRVVWRDMFFTCQSNYRWNDIFTPEYSHSISWYILSRLL